MAHEIVFFINIVVVPDCLKFYQNSYARSPAISQPYKKSLSQPFFILPSTHCFPVWRDSAGKVFLTLLHITDSGNWAHDPWIVICTWGDGWVLCCLVTPVPSKNIQCRVWSYFLNVQITTPDIRPNVKSAVNLVIEDGHLIFLFPLCGYMYGLTCSL